MRLNTDWFLEPVIDFEIKKYQLLAYLKEKKEELELNKLVLPYFELKAHKITIEEILHNKMELEATMFKELEKIDWKNFEMIYKNDFPQNKQVEEIMEIIYYSYPRIKQYFDQFKNEMEEIKKQIQLDVVGILPKYTKEGFLILEQPSGLHLFSYSAQEVLDLEGEKKFLHQHIFTYENTILHTPNRIKQDLIIEYKDRFPNPAVFVVSCATEIPIYETMLPLGCAELKKFVA